jgi:hypothetical protein
MLHSDRRMNTPNDRCENCNDYIFGSQERCGMCERDGCSSCVLPCILCGVGYCINCAMFEGSVLCGFHTSRIEGFGQALESGEGYESLRRREQAFLRDHYGEDEEFECMGGHRTRWF